MLYESQKTRQGAPHDGRTLIAAPSRAAGATAANETRRRVGPAPQTPPRTVTRHADRLRRPAAVNRGT